MEKIARGAWFVLAFGLAAGPIAAQSAPFLSSEPYLDTELQPTEFLVTLDDGEEVTSAAALLHHTYTIAIPLYDAATTYKITIGGFDVTQVGTGGSTSATAAAFVTALNASVNANFTPITWTSADPSEGVFITGTHDLPGVSFTPTSSKTGGTGTISTPVETVEPDEAFLLYNLDGILFGSHTASVKAQNNTATSAAATLDFEVGVQTPEILIVPVAP